MALYLTAREVADRWGSSARHVRRLCERGQLAGLQGAGFGKWRIAIAEVERYEAAHTTTAETAQPTRTAPKTKEVQQPVKLDSFTLPADYEPVFPALWPGHEPRATKSASRG